MKLNTPKVTRTKVLLWNSLCELIFLEKKEFDAITINDICTHAIVHRSTFYNHFADKFHLFQFGYHLTLTKRAQHPVEKRFFQPFSTNRLTTEPLQFPILSYKFTDSLTDVIQSLHEQDIEYSLFALIDHGYTPKLPLKITAELLSQIYMTLLEHILSKTMTIDEADHVYATFIKQGCIHPSK